MEDRKITFIIKNKYIIKLLKNRIAVPTFFIMSFYFSYKLISSKDIKKIKKDLKDC